MLTDDEARARLTHRDVERSRVRQADLDRAQRLVVERVPARGAGIRRQRGVRHRHHVSCSQAARHIQALAAHVDHIEATRLHGGEHVGVVPRQVRGEVVECGLGSVLVVAQRLGGHRVDRLNTHADDVLPEVVRSDEGDEGGRLAQEHVGQQYDNGRRGGDLLTNPRQPIGVYRERRAHEVAAHHIGDARHARDRPQLAQHAQHAIGGTEPLDETVLDGDRDLRASLARQRSTHLG